MLRRRYLPPAVQSEAWSSGMRFHFAPHATWLVMIRDFPEEDHPHPWGSHPVGLSTYYETSHPDRDRGKSGQTDHVRGPDGVARGSARPGADTSGQGTGATRWTFPVASTRFAGIADRSKLSPRPAMAAGVAHAIGGSSAVRTPARSPGATARPFGPGGSQCRSGKSDRGTGRPPGGAANEPWKERSFQGRFAAPPTRPTRPRGSTTAGRDRIDALGRRLGQAADVGWIANEADPGGGGRARARPAWRLATIHATKGGTGRPPGAANEPWKERSFQGRIAAPRAVQGSKPFSNGLAPRSPATRARISSKAANPAKSQGKAAEWRCIHAHFPVRNRIIP